jgi:hypothetical protein
VETQLKRPLQHFVDNFSHSCSDKGVEENSSEHVQADVGRQEVLVGLICGGGEGEGRAFSR